MFGIIQFCQLLFGALGLLFSGGLFTGLLGGTGAN